jgi:O-glycosyl hydrolase
MPIYQGLRMFSGGQLFRPFGAIAVSASTTLPQVEVFASTNGQNVVMINKDPAATQTAVLQASNTTASTVDVWQTDNNAPFQAPQLKANLGLSDGVSYVLPPYSVTTFVFR